MDPAPREQLASPQGCRNDTPARSTDRPRKIRVLHLVDCLKGGGVEEFIKEVARLTDPKRFDVSVAYLLDLRNRNGTSVADEIAALGVPVRYLGPPRRTVSLKGTMVTSALHSRSPLRQVLHAAYLPVALAALPKLLRLVRDARIDVIHVHLHYAFLLGLLARRLRGVQLVYQLCETMAQMTEEGRPRWFLPALRAFGRHVPRFLTEHVHDPILEAGRVPTDRVRQIRSGIDPSRVRLIPPEENPVIRKLGLGGAYPVLLTLGRLTPEKGHRFAIEALARLRPEFPDARLLILGDGWEFPALESLIRERGLEGAAHLVGFQSDLAPYLSAAHIYLRTHLKEGGTFASHWAMAYGLPPVGFDTKSGSETIQSGENGLLVPCEDVEGLADAAAELARCPDRRCLLGRQARETIRESRDLLVTVRALEEEYRALCRAR